MRHSNDNGCILSFALESKPHGSIVWSVCVIDTCMAFRTILFQCKQWFYHLTLESKRIWLSQTNPLQFTIIKALVLTPGLKTTNIAVIIEGNVSYTNSNSSFPSGNLFPHGISYHLLHKRLGLADCLSTLTPSASSFTLVSSDVHNSGHSHQKTMFQAGLLQKKIMLNSCNYNAEKEGEYGFPSLLLASLMNQLNMVVPQHLPA